MENAPSILAVDDDLTARTFIKQTLSSLPISVHVAATCREFRDLAEKLAVSLYLIDVELPDGDGYSLAEAVRRKASAPVVFLSVHDDVYHKLRALERGAVDYVSKPVHPRELALRIQNILRFIARPQARRTQERQGLVAPPLLRRFAHISFDLARRRLSDARGSYVDLTVAEADVLALLTAAPQRVVSRQEIVRHLGPQSAAHQNARIIDILISRLRRKLGGDSPDNRFIVTVPDRGYMFVEAVS